MNISTYIYYLATCSYLAMVLFVLSSVSLDGILIKQVTHLTLCEVFNQQQSLKTFLTEVHQLLKLYLTIPVTTASSKRNFRHSNVSKLISGIR